MKNQFAQTVMDLKLEQAKAALTKNNMETFIVKDCEALRALVASMIPAGATVATGGSCTLDETGVSKMLLDGNYDFYYRGRTDPESGEPIDVWRKAFYCDWYLSSANAITLNGELVNIDGNGGRVAAIAYGPKNVIIVAGQNKLVRDLAEAERRLREIASPANCVRLNRNTPCRKTGRCMDCASDERICATTAIYGRQATNNKNRIKVILLPESFGF